MSRIGVILGHTRQGRNGEAVPHRVVDVASQRDDANYELVDLADFPLPQ